MIQIFFTCLISIFCLGLSAQTTENLDYTNYHKRVVEAETWIAAENYTAAIQVYEELFNQYEFAFRRDYQIATQLALFLKDEAKAQSLLNKGITAGWTLKSIRKNTFLKPIRPSKKHYNNLRASYENSLNQDIRKQVKKLFTKDQRKALGAFIRFSDKAQNRYAEAKFAPHSEQQLEKATSIIENYGYPGENLIGNNFWMSTILSHHNSISTPYNRKDTLYQKLQPKLLNALKIGQISAFEYVLIDEWYRASINQENLPTYGILDGPSEKDLDWLPIN